MSGGAAEVPAQGTSRRLRFDRYILDLDRGSLRRDGSDIALRPKTFAVLEFLVRNANRLVSKDEIFAAVWPDLAITDDALVQSIGELRRALGDDGTKLIRTLPRRGYRLECAVTPMADTAIVAPRTGGVIVQAGAMPDVAAAATRRRMTTLRSLPVRHPALLMCVTLIAAVFGAAVLPGSILPTLLGMGGPAPTLSLVSTRPAIAVLPLANQSGDSGREYFADGLTQDVINALGRFSALTVMSWNAVLPYKGNPAAPENIGRELGVGYMVEGSVNQIDNRVRVIAQLVDTQGGEVLWAARYEEALANLFQLQDTITSQIVSALASRVAQIEQRRVFSKPTENLEAYDYVLRARPALLRPTRGNNVEARALLRRAIELDPNFAAAYAALAETYYTATSMGWAESPTDYLDRAEQLALEALSLDSAEVRALVVLARIHILHQSYAQAEAEIELAQAVNPNDARVIAGRGNVYMWLGRADAAIESLEQAQRIDPDLAAMDRFALSLGYYLKGRYSSAVEQAELNLRDTGAANFSLVVLAAAYAKQNRPEDAARVVAALRRLDPTFDPSEFGSKFLSARDLEHLRDGLRLAGLYAA